MSAAFDTVIIGAGNAGVSLAARLRRDGRHAPTSGAAQSVWLNGTQDVAARMSWRCEYLRRAWSPRNIHGAAAAPPLL